MKLLDLITAPWAIAPEKLREIQAIYATHLRGEKIDVDAIEARLGRPLANEQQEYQIMQGGVAVLSLEGVMAPKANLFMRISGGVSTQLANTQIESAIADPRVTAIVLSIDSPGGSVFGTPELAATVRELSAIKPIVTVTEATLASAAYWVGAAANAVYISGPTVQVGSIGVVASHSYDPRSNGTVTEITAGKYKRIASANGPLSDEGRAYMQGHVDHLYSVFVDAVAGYRGTTPEAVLENMADGRVFIGQQAIDHGLVDGMSTVDAMVEQLAANPAKFARRQKAVFALGGLPSPSAEAAGAQASAPPAEPVQLEHSATSTQRTPTMDRATLEKDHPALFAQLQTEFLATGASAERARIQAVESALIPGHEALIAGLKFDGKTTGGDAAIAVNKAERDLRVKQGAASNTDAPAPVASTPPPAVDASASAKEDAEKKRLAGLPVEERCKAQWEGDANLRAEFSSLSHYTALVKAEESGKVRVLGKKAA
ncbi:ClpP class periplasmic serine protease [Polaromonas sp. CF318]|uniref:S49 family peptidase n=1 Tax=Polaromonas sp. CF318 TaxID=1144318 RepID=UPI0002714516|nr:S49 family peptidase [Polaromonas sp. CF318]EJL77351.1 ClpP class periplasmic serine protease [Polaromonas sp. CF318]